MSLTSPDDPRIMHHYADVGEVLLHYVTAGHGFPVVMIHGYPQTWWEWRHQIPALSEKYTVITPDMRGLGDSSRPQSGYDKKTIADDIWRMVNGELGHEFPSIWSAMIGAARQLMRWRRRIPRRSNVSSSLTCRSPVVVVISHKAGGVGIINFT